MSDQDSARTPTILRPLNDDKEAWSAYWIHQGQSWRTEPEIDSERQKYLDERRQITPEMKVGIYPFKDIKLTSFHGRGFIPGLGNEASLHNPLVMLAAIEAVVGLFIEISFIATFTKRFFGS
jgi:hypothetical protein